MSKVKSAPPKPRIVEMVRSSYQATKEEMEEDVRVDATFEEAVKALVQPVEVVLVDRPRRQE